MVMKKQDKYTKKSYAMGRMTLAIERAIERPTSKEKTRAAQWAAAWGLLCGIRTEGVNLKVCDIQGLECRIGQASDPTFALAAPAQRGLDSAVEPQPAPDIPSAVPLDAHAAATFRRPLA